MSIIDHSEYVVKVGNSGTHMMSDYYVNYIINNRADVVEKEVVEEGEKG